MFNSVFLFNPNTLQTLFIHTKCHNNSCIEKSVLGIQWIQSGDQKAILKKQNKKTKNYCPGLTNGWRFIMKTVFFDIIQLNR